MGSDCFVAGAPDGALTGATQSSLDASGRGDALGSGSLSRDTADQATPPPKIGAGNVEDKGGWCGAANSAANQKAASPNIWDAAHNVKVTGAGDDQDRTHPIADPIPTSEKPGSLGRLASWIKNGPITPTVHKGGYGIMARYRW